VISAPWLALAFMNRDRLLDLYPAAVGYSLRKIKKGVGKCISVRTDRSGASPDTIDIGFTSNGELDQVALLAHCGSDNGYVTKWYNQETNGASGNFVQVTAAQQPRIVTAGEVLTRYGKPMIQMATTSQYLNCEDLTIFQNRDYNRVYFTLSKSGTAAQDNLHLLYCVHLSGGTYYGRFGFRYGAATDTQYQVLCDAQQDNEGYGPPGSDVDRWRTYLTESTDFRDSISTINIVANWNPPVSGVPVGSGNRQARVIRHANNRITSRIEAGELTQNTLNTAATNFTLGGYLTGAIGYVSTNHGYNELIIYSDATYHNDNPAIEADIQAYY